MIVNRWHDKEGEYLISFEQLLHTYAHTQRNLVLKLYHCLHACVTSRHVTSIFVLRGTGTGVKRERELRPEGKHCWTEAHIP